MYAVILVMMMALAVAYHHPHIRHLLPGPHSGAHPVRRRPRGLAWHLAVTSGVPP
jgi:hypothetical protein